ncbi:unnamed protein product [Brassica oleracea]
MGSIVREWVGFQQFPAATQEKLIEFFAKLKQKDMNSLTVVVMGKGGVGKSSTVNSLIGEQVVRVSPFQAEGLRPVMVSRTMGGFTINIIDTPGLVEAGYVNHQALELIKGFLVNRTIDVLLYVDRLDVYRVDELDKQVVQAITQTFGKEIWCKTLLVLTHAQFSPPDDLSYETFSSKRSDSLLKTIRAGSKMGKQQFEDSAIEVVYAENSGRCSKNDKEEKALPNGEAWIPNLVKAITDVATNQKKAIHVDKKMVDGSYSDDKGKKLIPLIIAAQLWSVVVTQVFDSFYIVPTCERSDVIVQRLNSSLASSTSISCTTFNILAPIYKRIDQLNQSNRESHSRDLWYTRNQDILELLLHQRSSVICLQEVWVANEELVNMYHDRLATAGYNIFQLPRTNRRGDGLLTAIHKDYFELVNYRELLFNDFGDRVAQLLHVRSLVPFPLNEKQDVQQEVLIVNTHLLFPHDSTLSIARLHQYQLQKASIAEDNKAFAFLGGNKQSDSLTYSGFCQALQKANLTGIPHGLSFQETKELWVRADLARNGVFDYEKLKKTWNMRTVDQSGKCKERVMESKKEEEAVGLKVKKAVLFPQETEKGLWPEDDYSLSDHACLTHMAMAPVVKLVLGSIAFATFWILAVFPSVPFLPIGRTAGSLFGAMLMVIFQVITPDQAYAAIDLPILGLLFGTMVVSIYLERADMFKYLGTLLSWRSRGAKDLLCRVCLVSAVSSALFTNDTCCVVLTEFVLKIARQKNLPPHPFLLALATSANIGSSATPIGNPQNLVIAVQSKISFWEFLRGVFPAMIVGITVNAVMLLAMYWRLLSDHKEEEEIEVSEGVVAVEEEDVMSHRFSPATLPHLSSFRSEETSSYPTVNSNALLFQTKRWRRVLWKSSVYLITLGMLISLLMGLNMSWTAITAALALVVLDFKDARPSLEKVSYSLLIFFCGMFITVDGFNKTGIPTALWDLMEPYANIGEAKGTAVLAVVILVLSNVASNVPTVLLLGARVAASAAAGEEEKKAWLLLAWVSTVAGNLTLLGSAANLIVCEQARRAVSHGYTLTFTKHLKFGLPSTLIVTAIGLYLIK